MTIRKQAYSLFGVQQSPQLLCSNRSSNDQPEERGALSYNSRQSQLIQNGKMIIHNIPDKTVMTMGKEIG